MHAELLTTPDALRVRWQALASDSESPDYYELNEYGEVILSPRPTNDHQRVAQAVAQTLTAQLGMQAVCEVSVLTDKGIRVPDVVWMSEASWAQQKGQTPLQKVPDLCVEVLSAGNTREEITMKIGAYLRGGASEVIVVDRLGAISYHGNEGALDRSAFNLVLALPANLF